MWRVGILGYNAKPANIALVIEVRNAATAAAVVAVSVAEAAAAVGAIAVAHSPH